MEIARESIFVSVIRSFCKVFFSVIGFFLAFFVVFFVYSHFCNIYEREEKTTITIVPDLKGEVELVPFHSPVVLKINIHGVIGEPKILDSDLFQDILIDSNRGVLKDRVKAILLHFNTPGGTVVDSDNIYRMLKAYKEQFKVPIYGYVDGLCASGGMYISCAADKMYASPASVIGSVGVIMGPFFNFVEGLSKIGISSKTFAEGLDKDGMNPFRPWKSDEGASLQSLGAFFYQRFVGIVVDSHPRVDKQKLISEYGANIFDGPKAQEIGFIDVADAEYTLALRDLLAQANVDANKPYQVIELSPKFSLFSCFSEKAANLLSGKIEHTFNFGDKRSAQIRDQFSYLYEPRWIESSSSTQ